MHLPDAFLDTKTALLSAGVAVAGIAYAVRQVRENIEPRQVPLLGLAGAFVFAAQMLNFPVIGGTSGHLLGGVLTAILLGPSAAVIVMSCVLIVQCLMFADGGLLALGANIFNMALVAVCGGYYSFRLTKSWFPMEETRGTVFAAAFAGWFGTVLGSITCAGQLALSGTAPWGVTFPAMANIHMLIGIGEGLATALIILALLRTPSFKLRTPAATAAKGAVFYGFLVTLGLAVFAAPFASPWPDGLEHVAEKLGFADKTSASVVSSPLTDYAVPWIASAPLGTALAGFIGTIFVFGAAYLLARFLVPSLQRQNTDAPSSS